MLIERGHFTSNKIQKGHINESLKSIRNFSAKTAFSTVPTVFLSHKHKDIMDQNELEGVIEKFEELGVKVYIDSLDNKMPEETSGVTAQRIKEVIKYCDKFVLLATEGAILSHWCNWELGIGDTYKYSQHIALLPIKEKGDYDDKYKGNEYLQIYPIIYYEDGTNYYDTGKLISKGYYVSKPANENGIRSISPLKTWLNQK